MKCMMELWQYDMLLMKDRALNYLSNCIDQVHTFGDILQLVIVELIYKVCCHTRLFYTLLFSLMLYVLYVLLLSTRTSHCEKKLPYILFCFRQSSSSRMECREP